MPRRFFFVAAGLFLLALAYQLGVTSATAQAPGTRVIGDYLVESGGAIYQLTGAFGWQPRTGPPVAVSEIAWAAVGNGSSLSMAITTSGEGWIQADGATGWVSFGPVPGATP